MIKEREKVISYLMKTFGYSQSTAVTWLNSPNWNFGGVSPETLIQQRNYHRVLFFLTTIKMGE